MEKFTRILENNEEDNLKFDLTNCLRSVIYYGDVMSSEFELFVETIYTQMGFDGNYEEVENRLMIKRIGSSFNDTIKILKEFNLTSNNEIMGHYYLQLKFVESKFIKTNNKSGEYMKNINK